MSNWHKQVTKNLSDAVSHVLKDYADHKAMQNGKLKGKGSGEQLKKTAQELPEDEIEPQPTAKKTKTETVSKAVRKTSAESKKIKLSKKKEEVKVNPSIGEHREHLKETLEASFDTIFQYSNKEEEAYREQWMNDFGSLVAEKDPHAYIDPLQSKVLYIEGMTPKQAASRYLSACIANAAMAGGEYKDYGTRGGDPRASARRQGQEVGNVIKAPYKLK